MGKPLRIVALAVIAAVGMIGLAVGSTTCAWAQDSGELARRQTEAQRQQEALRARIQSLQQRIESHESDRRQATDALRQSERAISDLNHRLAELAVDIAQARAELDALDADIQRQSADLAARREALARQLRVQYATGLSPWTALLSGGNPQELGRHLVYLDYLSKARATEVDAVHREIERLEALRVRERKRRAEWQGMQQEATQRRAELLKQQQARATVLARLEGQIKAQRSEAGRLNRDDQRLSGLISELGQQVEAARQEEARLAAEAEAARQEAARQEQARQEAARQATQQEKRAAQQNAKRQAAQQAQPSVRRAAPPPAPEPALRQAHGLRTGLPMPVRGKLIARFGSARPSGGNWRGILLGAPEGAPVKAVGAGTVVYADWLRGFGNLLIVDHGQQFMTVYAHNQSLLKKVGDVVRVGDTIATVGATGGQAESGLYFEIRHRGEPQDPGKFLRADGA